MDDFAKSAFLWAERILEEQKEEQDGLAGICFAVLSVIDPSTGTFLCVGDIRNIFLPFAELHDGFAWEYPGDENPCRRRESILGYWFFPYGFLAPRKRLIHCLLSHSPL